MAVDGQNASEGMGLERGFSAPTGEVSLPIKYLISDGIGHSFAFLCGAYELKDLFVTQQEPLNCWSTSALSV